jgi:hypothetical protein
MKKRRWMESILAEAGRNDPALRPVWMRGHRSKRAVREDMRDEAARRKTMQEAEAV